MSDLPEVIPGHLWSFAQVLAAYRDHSWPVWVDNRGHHWVERPDGMVHCVIDDRSAGLSMKTALDRSYLGPLTLHHPGSPKEDR